MRVCNLIVFLVFPTLITDILMPNLPSIQPQRCHECHPPKKKLSTNFVSQRSRSILFCQNDAAPFIIPGNYFTISGGGRTDVLVLVQRPCFE